MIALRMWRNLALMGERYAQLGYQDLPQPWVASDQAIRATLPADALPNTLNDSEILVGSAEQAFIDRMLAGRMPQGRWQAITPCFRREPVFDVLHKPYFMKLELIDYMPPNPGLALEVMLSEARSALANLERSLLYAGPVNGIGVEQTAIGWDLTLRGQEIGSYGIREFEGHCWVYGTGIAEPRFTTLLEG